MPSAPAARVLVRNSQAKPWQRRHLVVQAQRAVAAADDVAVFRLARVFAEECEQVARIGERGVFGPFHLDGREPSAVLDDEIHFRAILRAEVGKFAAAEVLQALPQLDADPLLEKRAGIGARGVGAGDDARRGVAHAEVEEKKAVGGEQVLRALPLKAGRRKPRNMSSRS